ncbi:putative aldouronate transport system substrate-binding protein [Paenibacillus algorifonticola]|uniref:Putative aldouronate transport system substrate-binding protein n=2 Tax=Paenibacillus algorifonticola TaxID=684063 RepID=A0A1I1Y345_9BACL|nr:extracellular solute-binding protein [Paenibacillus algorifonticola]SFE12493.1 putative aldouronate transport system substrate-binding protein [Paenibacillus algorifonticola]
MAKWFNKKTVSKPVILLLSLTMLVAGCSNSNSSSNNESVVNSNSNNQTPAAFSYPMQGNAELSFMNEQLGGTPEVMPIDEEYEKRTGISIKHLGGTPMTDQKFSLLLASGELPDIFLNTWLQYPGGPDRAVEQGYILKLNDLIDQYAPNLKKTLQDNPDIDKMIKTDDGTYYAFPFIRSDAGRVYGGPIIRKDWLDELKLDIPQTIDEWHTVLTAFKEKKKASSPVTFRTMFLGERTGGFAGAFGVMGNFYVNDGKVVYGYLELEYKEYLRTMSQWYKEGLIDKDFASIDAATVDKKMSSGGSGATIGWQFYIEKYNAAAQETDPNANFVAAPYPAAVKGGLPEFGQLDNAYAGTSSAAISSTTKNVEAAIRWLDYAYSQEGSMLNTFGVEGVTYNLENGKPVYTDLVVNNPEGLGSDQVMLQYSHGTNFPMIQQDNNLPSKYPQTAEALGIWQKTNHESHLLPPVTPTAEEADEMSSIMNDINALVKEAELKIILGNESADNYDKYVQQMKDLGIERALEIQQAAYERYLKR